MSRYYVVRMPVAEARHLAGVGRARPAGGPGASPAGGRPARGPFVPDRYGIVPPGRVEYLGAGTVRLDEDAIGSLAVLRADADFRVVFADSGPVLLVGTDHYPVTELNPRPEEASPSAAMPGR